MKKNHLGRGPGRSSAWVLMQLALESVPLSCDVMFEEEGGDLES